MKKYIILHYIFFICFEPCSKMRRLSSETRRKNAIRPLSVANWRYSVKKSESRKNLIFLLVSVYKSNYKHKFHKIYMKTAKKLMKTDV